MIMNNNKVKCEQRQYMNINMTWMSEVMYIDTYQIYRIYNKHKSNANDQALNELIANIILSEL